MFQYKSINVIL